MGPHPIDLIQLNSTLNYIHVYHVLRVVLYWLPIGFEDLGSNNGLDILD